MNTHAKELVSQMTVEEKASLCSGLDMWHLKAVERLGLPSIMVTDGPHGLRKQKAAADHLGLNESVPATCFPAASATAASWDTDLLEEMGRAIGDECLAEKVAVILGPGINIKRSPLCGRNFEYFSEDPLVSGDLGAALIDGIQSRGVGTSLKHFAANNQEKARLTNDSVIDERALREIYLAGFERAVKKSRPWTVMNSYNRLNGTYVSEHRWLLTQVLRDEWGFDGLVMTDWGAIVDRVKGIEAGVDLEMPASGGVNDQKIVEAVKSGALDEKLLDICACRAVDLILKFKDKLNGNYAFDKAAHHKLARKAAASSAVLLKNEGGVLPLKAGCSAAVIGAFATKPRYQGAGSSKINPTMMDSPFDELAKLGVKAEYAEGYSLAPGSGPDSTLIGAAASLATGKDVALVFAGLPDEYESEGFDRSSMAMPESHVKLIEAVAAANANTVVVLLCGSPVECPWADKVKGILLMYLGGQAVGGAAADLLTGAVNPSGKLAESWPFRLNDTPCAAYYPGMEKTAEYREGLFAGYRYYDTVKKPVRWPFGFGLSYTNFEISGLELSAGTFDPAKDREISVSVTVKNTGKAAGAEVVQIYVGKKALGVVFRPVNELRAFKKVFLKSGEAKTVTLKLDARAFSYWNTAISGWAVEGGGYCVSVCKLTQEIDVKGDGKESLLAALKDRTSAYFNLAAGKAPSGTLTIPDADFEALLGRPIPPARYNPADPCTPSTPLGLIKDTAAGRPVYEMAKQNLEKMFGGGEDKSLLTMFQAMMDETPLRSLVMFSGGAATMDMIEGICQAVNAEKK